MAVLFWPKKGFLFRWLRLSRLDERVCLEDSLKLPKGKQNLAGLKTLFDVEIGKRVRVVEISRVCQGAQRRRLLDLGIVRGTEITPALASAVGNPVAYEILGALIALRSRQAKWIRVESV